MDLDAAAISTQFKELQHGKLYSDFQLQYYINYNINMTLKYRDTIIICVKNLVWKPFRKVCFSSAKILTL